MRKFNFLLALLTLSLTATSQSSEQDQIKMAIKSEVDAFNSRNLEAWRSLWVQNPQAYRTFASRYGYNAAMSWDSIDARTTRNFKQNPKPNPDKWEGSDYGIHADGNMAIVNYKATITPEKDNSNIYPYVGKQNFNVFQTLVKDNGQWKTLARIITAPETYSDVSHHTAEAQVNQAGYALLAAKRIEDAIEIFKMNVKMFPNSWNVYDSLAEAYAEAGNKKKAIELYEKSIKMNPDNENGKTYLEKLKAKKDVAQN